MTSQVTVMTVTQSCDIEKIIEGSGTNNVIQYGNNMLVLWKTYVLEGRIVVVCT